MKYITTPIYYANGTPHAGHIYSTIIGDIIKKACILLDKEVFFVSGMDEHGQKVSEHCEKIGMMRQEYVNFLANEFFHCFESYDIKIDRWVRTTSTQHKKTVEYFWNLLKSKGYIYKGTYSGWYAVRDEAYYADSDLVDGKAPSGAPVVWMEEPCYYFKLSAFEDKLRAFFKNNPDFIYPNKRQNEALGFLNQGLRDLAISRPKKRVSWGIQVPDDEDHTVYVWIDALTNYLSAINYPNEDYKKYWPATHILGKDILKFHAIYWVAMLMAADIEPPKKLLVHGWWMNGEDKISKSLNNALDLEEMKKKYQKDGIRYFLAKAVNFGEDGEFSEANLKKVVYSDLANGLGNTFLRVIGLIESIKESVIPKKTETIENEVSQSIADLRKSMEEMIENPIYFSSYVQKIHESVNQVNAYMQKEKPWENRNDIKRDSQFYFLCDSLRKIAILSYPVIPNTAKAICDIFDVQTAMSDYDSNFNGSLGKKNQNKILFPKTTNEIK
jgi:methionyl-tRNA synthetase